VLAAVALSIICPAAITRGGSYSSVSIDDLLMIATRVEPTTETTKDHPSRRDAISELGERANISVEEEAKIGPVLGACLRADDSNIRYAAAAALGRLGNTQFVPELFARLETEPNLFSIFFFVRRVRAEGPPEAMLYAGLRASNAEARHVIIQIISAYKIVSFRPEIERVLEADNSNHVRRAAALALGTIGNAESICVLERALQNDPRNDGAVDAVGKLGGDAQVPTLLPLLYAADAQVRAHALQSLSSLKVKDARPICGAFLKILQEHSEQPFLSVACALARRKDPRVLPFLRRIVEARSESGIADLTRDVVGQSGLNNVGQTHVLAIANIDGPESTALLNEMIGCGYREGFGLEDELAKRADSSSGPLIWAAYLKDPIRRIVSGWCATTGGYRSAPKVLAACADKELLEKIRARANETTEKSEKRALTSLVTQIEQRFAQKKTASTAAR
jgi:HEAT repeat protein